MTAGLLGKKIGMTQLIDDHRMIVPVTMLRVDTHEVLQVKTREKDRTNAIVVGIDPLKKQTKMKKFKVVREFHVEDPSIYSKGQQLNLALLQDIKTVSLSSVSKGKGFQGVMKRYNFHGGPASHGSHFHREPGSIGQREKPGKVQKGKKLPGHMGVERITITKRPVIKCDPKEKMIYIKGTVAGSRNSLIEIRY